MVFSRSYTYTFVFLALIKKTHTGSHSLWVMATFIAGETQFPKFSAVLMVDDVQVEYFDSNESKVIMRRHWKAEDVVEEADLKNTVMSMIRDHLNVYFQQLKPRFNHTGGVHTYQRMTGCELNDEDESPLMLWDAYDGIDTRSYNKGAYIHNPLLPELMWSKLKIEASKLVNTNLYQPLCIRTLKNYLQQEKNTVKRKVRPKVRVIQKTHPESGVLQVVCLATGFYPRHINMTLLRDGRTIPEESLLTGDLLPNGDGTYQQRRILGISSEEMKERHDYTCTVTHTSLSNKLDVTWEPGPALDVTFIAVVVSVAVSVVVLLVLAVAAFIKWKRRSAGLQGYLPPASSSTLNKEENDISSSTSSL
nr:MHC class I antigen [Anguilla japonica]